VNQDHAAQAHRLEMLETRLGARLAGLLAEPAGQLPADVLERLRFARTQALERRAPAAATQTTLAGRAGGALTLGGLGLLLTRLGAALPVLVLALGFMVVDRANTRGQVLEAAAIDARLLTDNLPPAAYSDPGFVEFLKLAEP
jgi:hypothetical protein